MGNRVTVTLPMESDLSGSADHELFFNPVRTSLRLREIANMESIEVEDGVHLHETLRFANEDLRHLEDAINQYPTNSKPSKGHVTFIEGADRHAEVHAVARTIRELMLSGKRYKDLAILYRQPEKYDELIETIFPHYEIPVFISRKKPMLHHPLIELSRSVLEAVTSGWSYESIFRGSENRFVFPAW